MSKPSHKEKKKDAERLIGTVIDKYTLNSYITSGGFGHVFVATVNDNTGRIFAIKVPIQSDTKKNYEKFLVREYKIINEISDRKAGIMSVKLVEWDKGGKQNRNKDDKDNKENKEEVKYVMVMDLLGNSLNTLKKKLTLNELVLVTIKMLYILKHIHSKGYLHRDIKPSNFVLHPSNNIRDGIFCIDFGLSIKHPVESDKVSFCGTETFASIAAHEGNPQSWKDDLESLVYCVISLHNTLSWKSSSMPETQKKERTKLIGIEKKEIKPKELLKGLPNEFKTLYVYSRSLGFGETPKYKVLISKFTRLLNSLEKPESSETEILDISSNT
jgi:serine/threonine protein kinase